MPRLGTEHRDFSHQRGDSGSPGNYSVSRCLLSGRSSRR